MAFGEQLRFSGLRHYPEAYVAGSVAAITESTMREYQELAGTQLAELHTLQALWERDRGVGWDANVLAIPLPPMPTSLNAAGILDAIQKIKAVADTGR